ncbi:OLC1v1024581C1 [Oldenlandia corymbosa var. corymbosa]|uniref:OLC1v1024581C1 n=1 Tax=Oldenlandia corymbosa var. corymbosa TaxID=529605 RepID=A0AAV1C432_OLDCO|nr:OLC1v1024581C1 [Oldenlandia corymbosa var. corymbosa]
MNLIMSSIDSSYEAPGNDTTLQLGTKNYPSISNPADIHISSKAPKAPLFAIKPTSNSSTTQLISFGSSSSSSATFSTNNEAGKSGSNLVRLNTRFFASTEKRTDHFPAMISFKENKNMDFSASAASSSSSSSAS